MIVGRPGMMEEQQGKAPSRARSHVENLEEFWRSPPPILGSGPKRGCRCFGRISRRPIPPRRKEFRKEGPKSAEKKLPETQVAGQRHRTAEPRYARSNAPRSPKNRSIRGLHGIVSKRGCNRISLQDPWKIHLRCDSGCQRTPERGRILIASVRRE